MEKKADAREGSSSDQQPLDIHRIKQLKATQHKHMGNAEFLRYLKSHPGLDTIVMDLERLWLTEHIPEFYSAGLLWTLKLHDLNVILERLREQFQLTRQRRSSYHRILESIRCRHICLEKIAVQLAAIHNLNILKMFRKKYTRDNVLDKLTEQAKGDGYKGLGVRAEPEEALLMLKDVFTDMCRLRQLTVYTVQLIHHWRFEVEQAMDSCDNLEAVYFLLQGRNYYEQLRTDTDFIWNSQLSLYILFEHDCDIFLVRNILAVEKLEEKELLEQYFLEIVYPKDDKIFDRTVEAMEYLTYKAQPTRKNQYEVEELLVENYIRMDYSPSKLQEEKLKQQEIEKRLYLKETAKEELKRSPLSVYKKKPVIKLNFHPSKLELQKKLDQKLDGLKRKIDQELDTIRVKPFSIVNFAAKNSLDLKFQKEREGEELMPFEPFKKVIEEHQKEEKQGEKRQPTEQQAVMKASTVTTHRLRQSSLQHDTKPQRKATVKSVLQSMEKASQKRKSKIMGFNRLYGQGKNRSHENIHSNHNTSYTFGSPYSPFKAKLNTFEKKKNKSLEELLETKQTFKQQIQVDEGFTPLNKRIFDVFGTIPVRASMTSVRKSKKRISIPAQTDRQGKLAKLDKDVRRMNMKPNFVIRRSKEVKLELAQKPERLYDEYERVPVPQLKLEGPLKDHKQFFMTSAQDQQQAGSKSQKEVFLRLKPKSVPLDILEFYLQHLFEIRNPVLALFTDYELKTVFTHLSAAQKVYIFELLDLQDETVGELIVSQHVSKIGLVKYEVEFIHVDRFEFFVQAVLLLSDQVFRASCAEELVIALKLDKMDDISRQFIKLIDSKFGERAAILQKKRPSYLGHDIHDRLYVLRPEPTLRLQMQAEGYDTRLFLKANAFVFCSNFKLRKHSYMTRHYQSTTRQLKVNISLLYAHVLEKIMTKHHLRLLRLAPANIKELMLLLYRMKTIPDYDGIQISEFKSTADLKNYLEYRSYDAEQRLLQFLSDSQFVMRKELVLAEFSVEMRLDYYVRQTVCRIDNQNYFYMMLQNHRRHPFEIVTSSDFCTQMVFVPCGDDHGYQLILMQAEQYMGLDVDLYTYLNSFLSTEKKRVQQVVETFCLPEAIFKHKVTESDILAEQFPERQFYYSGQIAFRTDRPLPLGIVRQPQGLVFQCPLIVGFFRKNLEVCYLVNKKHMVKESYP